MRIIGIKSLLILALAAVVTGTAGCGAKTDEKGIRGETIATVNGEAVPVRELREFLGIPGGVAQAKDLPAGRKKEALDRLIGGRLIAQEARAKGLDNTDEFHRAIEGSGQMVLITAIFRRELDRMTISGSEVDAETKKLRTADNTLSEENARARASRQVAEAGVRKIESDLVAAARKDLPSSIDQEKINRIASGRKVADGEVLATAGDARIDYGQVKTILQGISGGGHGGQDLSRNPMAIGKVLDREITGRVLAAYAKKQGVEGTEYAKDALRSAERSALIDLMAVKMVSGNVSVTDKEIAAAYAEHSEMFVRDGRKIPLASVKDQIRGFLQNEKKRKVIEAYVNDLRKKAKIEVKEDLLSKI